MNDTSYYQEYAQLAIEDYSNRTEQEKNLLVDAVRDIVVERVLDIGCGAGQEMVPFAKKKNSYCVGIDIGEELGRIGIPFVKQLGTKNQISFTRGLGEQLPFADTSFDLVICRVALPYMDNKKAIAEVSRILRPGGSFFLKTHAPAFYIEMIKTGLSAFELRRVAYALICLAAGIWHILTGIRPNSGFWAQKEVFQTKRSLLSELKKNRLKIIRELPDSDHMAPSYYIEKD